MCFMCLLLFYMSDLIPCGIMLLYMHVIHNFVVCVVMNLTCHTRVFLLFLRYVYL